MKFKELLEDEIFDLPLIQNSQRSFDSYISSILTKFLEKINNLDEETLNFEDFEIHTNFIKETQKIIVTNLKKCVQAYFNGQPFRAYGYLEKALQNNQKDLPKIFKYFEYNENENFYRIRLNDNNFTYSKDELFHIPFQLRNKVSTQRFSIPGFPSLYLGRTIYICWEELLRPSVDKIQAVRLQNTKVIKCLDLTPPSKDCDNLYEKYKFLMTFPIIACCSVKVYDTSDIFKPEYIFPQLLLQWVRNNGSLDGIKYKSTHITSESYKEDSELINLVLPVKTNRSSGLCTDLKSSFISTEVISWNLYQFAMGGQIFLYTSTDEKIVNDKIPHLELIKDKKYPYFYSTLGRLEYYLEFMKTAEI